MRFDPLHNLTLKLSAVVLALLLWVHVATNKSYEYQIDLPIHLINVPRGLVMISDLPKTVSVKIRATGKQLLALSTREPIFTINAAEYKMGTFEFVITNPLVTSALDRAYEEVEVVYPKDLILRFERESEKRVPVVSVVRAEAAPGYSLAASPKIIPDSVEVMGPAPVIAKLKKLETTETQFVNLLQSVKQRISLVLPESLNLSLKDSTVIVSIEIEARIQKTFTNLPILPPDNFNANRFNIMPSHLTLVLGVPQSRAGDLKDSDIVLTFKRPATVSETAKAAIVYKIPENVEMIGNMPDSILIVKKP